MGALYPGNWGRHFKTQEQIKLAMSEWGKELEKLDKRNVMAGIEKLKERGGDFPPSLPEFLALCKKQQAGLSHNTAAYEIVDRSKRLEKKIDPGKARVHIETMWNVLK